MVARNSWTKSGNGKTRIRRQHQPSDPSPGQRPSIGSRERFTMDDGLSERVKEVFVRLHEDGLIYRGKRLVNWDHQTAHRDFRPGSGKPRRERLPCGTCKYPLADGAKTAEGKDYLIVATTRPETMLGDTAVAVNPERPALPGADRQVRRAAAGWPPHPDHRGRLLRRRYGIRHRLRENHPGPRFQRL
jgi:hypothetical protein